MRGIEFRGKARMTIEELNDIGLSSSNGWVYGNLIQSSGLTFIVGGVVDWCDEYLAHEWWVQVDPDTVGQYTGLKDKHGTKIFEDDVVDAEPYSDRKYLVSYDEDRAGYYPFAQDDGCGCCSDELVSRPEYCEVIGNKFENPELLNN